MNKKMFSVLYNLLFGVLACVFLFSAWMMFTEIKTYKQEKEANEVLNQYVEVPVIDKKEDEEQAVVDDPFPEVDFTSLLEINQDCIGWIYIPDSNVNYPVVQTDNNDYYLKRLFDKTWGHSGTIFLDAENDVSLTGRHSILYGHHMKNGTMFGDVENYEKQEFADQHPTGYLVTLDSKYELQFFAGYVTDTLNDCWEIEFENDAVFEQWLKDAKDRSAFQSEITPEITDRIITLSTCSYDIEDGRFVLLGIPVEKR